MSRRKPETYRIDFASVAELMEYATDGASSHAANVGDQRRIMTEPGDEARTGLPGMTTAADIRALVSNGWTDGAGKVTKQAQDVQIARLPSVRRRRIRGDHGDSIDMARVYAGALDTAWTRTARASSQTPPRVRIVTNMATPAGTKGSALFWRGAAPLALADRLTESGYMVQMVTAMGGNFCTAGTEPFLINAVTKDWTAPLDISTLASTTALAGFFRTFGFSAVSKLAPTEHSIGLATPREPSPSDFDDDAHITLIIGDTVRDERSARAWLARAVEAIQPEALAQAA